MFWLLKKPLQPYKEKWKGSRQKFLTWKPTGTVGKERSEKLFFLHIFSLRNLISLQPVSKREKSALLQLQNNNAVCHVVLFNIFPVLQSHNRLGKFWAGSSSYLYTKTQLLLAQFSPKKSTTWGIWSRSRSRFGSEMTYNPAPSPTYCKGLSWVSFARFATSFSPCAGYTKYRQHRRKDMY